MINAMSDFTTPSAQEESDDSRFGWSDDDEIIIVDAGDGDTLQTYSSDDLEQIFEGIGE